MSTRAWRRRQAALEAEQVVRAIAERPARKKPTLPEGIGHVLKEKGNLEAYLQGFQKHPVVVSIDLIGEEWVFTVRGIQPPIEFWEGTRLFCVRGGSSNVWTPTKALR